MFSATGRHTKRCVATYNATFYKINSKTDGSLSCVAWDLTPSKECDVSICITSDEDAGPTPAHMDTSLGNTEVWTINLDEEETNKKVKLSEGPKTKAIKFDGTDVCKTETLTLTRLDDQTTEQVRTEKLKAGKDDGDIGSGSNYILRARNELYVHE